MILSDAQAREIIQAPRNRESIDEVKDQESSLRCFTEENSLTELQKERYWKHFLKVMKTRSDKKFERVSQFFRFPLPIVQITDSILNDFFKVYEGKNRFFDVMADDDIGLLDEWIFMTRLERWVEDESKEVFRNQPSKIVVVDRDEDGMPYLISVGTDRLMDVNVKEETGQIGYIVFKHSYRVSNGVKFKLTAVYDEERYRVFEQNESGGSARLIINVEHGLGYCPAHMFVFSPANSHNWFKRRTPFGQSVSKMEDWSIFDVFRNYVDHYAPFPITESPVTKCANPKCKNGKTSEEQVVDAATGETRTIWKTCQVCEGKDKMNLMGPGTHIGIKIQADRNIEDGSGKFKMHFPETDKMKYVPEKLDDLELEIRYKTVGISQLLDTQAVNELQAKGSFASMDNVLLRTKTELDHIYKWIVYTVGGLIYPDVQIHVEANFGTEWYLVSEEELQKRFENAKKIGLPRSEQLMIYDQIIETKYKGNASKVLRQKMLLQLDPLPLYTVTEAIDLAERGVVTEEELNLKINFFKFVQRFEEQNASITDFGANIEMRVRLNRIREILNQYNNEDITSKQLSTGGTGTPST